MNQGFENRSRFKKPPLLHGYTFRPEQARMAGCQSKLLSIRIEINNICNLRCKYCYHKDHEYEKDEIEFIVLQGIIDQAYDLGAGSVVISGGEPLLYPKFQELICFINNKKMIPVVLTNGLLVTNDVASYLYEKNVSVIAKLDSLRPSVQDYCAGLSGAYIEIQAGLHNLIQAGFTQLNNPELLRMGISVVCNRMNVDEVEEIWHFCRRHNIFPDIRILKPVGMAKKYLSNYYLDNESIKRCKTKMLTIDREHYGFDWLPYTPVFACSCFYPSCSLYVTVDGNVRPCPIVRFDENRSFFKNGLYPYNVFHRNLKDIYSSEIFCYARNVEKYLEGKCSDCLFLEECIGCRGNAYNIGIEQGLDPYQAFRMECLQCFK